MRPDDIANIEESARRLYDAVTAASDVLRVSFVPISTAAYMPEMELLPISEEIRSWYAVAAPIDARMYLFDSYGTLVLYDPRNLVEYQSGYRWHGQTGLEISEWQPEWLVIGDSEADPIIAHTDQPGVPVSIALHGQGEWQPVRIAQDLSAFLAAMAICVEIGTIKYRRECDSESGDLRPEVMADLHTALAEVLELDCLDFWPLGYKLGLY